MLDAAAWQRRVRGRLEEHLAKCVQDCQQAVGSEVPFGAEWGIRPVSSITLRKDTKMEITRGLVRQVFKDLEALLWPGECLVLSTSNDNKLYAELRGGRGHAPVAVGLARTIDFLTDRIDNK